MKLRMQREALEKMNRQANEMNAEGTTAVQEPGSLCTVPAHFRPYIGKKGCKTVHQDGELEPEIV